MFSVKEILSNRMTAAVSPEKHTDVNCDQRGTGGRHESLLEEGHRPSSDSSRIANHVSVIRHKSELFIRLSKGIGYSASASFTQVRSGTGTGTGTASRATGRHSKFSSHSAASEKDNTSASRILLLA